jgi:enamine deaminase RidA (YjgF/YER057c/UK114 family)
VAVATGSRTVHFAGQLALDRDFNVIGGDDLGEQTKAAMRNLEIAMAEVGATWDDIVRRTIYTLRPTEYETITAAIDEVTGGADHPAQTIQPDPAPTRTWSRLRRDCHVGLGVTGLALPGLLIEIEATASLSSP